MSCERPSARIDRNNKEYSMVPDFTIKDVMILFLLYIGYVASAAIMLWILNR